MITTIIIVVSTTVEHIFAMSPEGWKQRSGDGGNDNDYDYDDSGDNDDDRRTDSVVVWVCMLGA
jgi:hypothetical protein